MVQLESPYLFCYMKKAISSLLILSVFIFLTAQENLDYFLPDDVTYNPSVPTPDQFFGQQLGAWHLTHGQVLSYMNEIARLSKRAILYEYARSHENKPLVHLLFTSKENQSKLEELRELHVHYSEPESDIPIQGVPLVVCLTYGVHGNESSATNSSVLTAYYLAAAEGDKTDSLLNNTIIIVDPCLNPDGFTRHTTWANMHQGENVNGDKNSRQFYEVWPGGRTNHYWFDMNRDYLLLVNPESRGRVEKFHHWRPNVVTDHHESSPDFSFFFQPGVPSRINPLTPDKNYELTKKIATYHARFLDEIGSYYFSEEQFDDYYFGKGSTYPDINGGVGILFEQASVRGRVRETSNGLNTLSRGMKNQFTVSLSTLEASRKMHNELLEFQKEFYRSALELGGQSETKAYLFGSGSDRWKANHFVNLLSRHQINVYGVEKDIEVNNQLFKAGESYIVPVEQKQYRLLTSIFEEVTTFKDTSFYDVSTWTFTHALDIPSLRLETLKDVRFSSQPASGLEMKGMVHGNQSELGYLFRWDEYMAPAALYKLQEAGLRNRVASKSFSFQINDNMEDFTRGSVFIPASHSELPEDKIYELVGQVALESGVDFYALETGFSSRGVDLGSSSFSSLQKPEIAMFIGKGTSSYKAGEIWHLFDQNYGIPVTLTPVDRLGSMDLNKYSRVILPGGTYGDWNEKEIEKLKLWILGGGILIACENAVSWAAEHGLGSVEYKEKAAPDSTRYLKYEERRKESAIQRIGGAILKTKMDITHPLCYGYSKEDLAIFKKGTSVVKPSGIKYAEPVRFDTNPYISGWVSSENLERISGAPVVTVQSIGKGKLIGFHETMNFRGFWMGTHKLFANAVFFGGIIR